MTKGFSLRYQKHRQYAAYAFFAFFTYVWFFHAWLSDDSLITLRQVLNITHGEGIVWNLGERVQAFTHPTWFWLLTIFSSFTGELFRTTLFISFGCTLWALYSLCRRVRDLAGAALMLSLLFSQAFVDFTSSGLENPLSYFFAAVIVYRFLERRGDRALFMLMALLFLNHMDYAVLLFPLAIVAWRSSRFSLRAVDPAIGIVGAWMLFSTYYFGHPLPNTFLAKLQAGYPLSEYLERAPSYFFATLFYDPLTFYLIFLGVVIPPYLKNRAWPLSLGIVLYLLYVASIGGDFMLGRYFALPAFVSVAILIPLCRELPRRTHYLIGAGLLVLAAIGTLPPLDTKNYKALPRFGPTVDERGGYFDRLALSRKEPEWPDVSPKTIAPQVRSECGGIGAKALVNNQDYWIDACGLGSPYLSRVPGIRREWWVGHVARNVPQDMLLWVLDEKAAFKDAELTRYFDDIRLVVHAPLWDTSRFAAIWRINTQHYDYDRDYFTRESELHSFTGLASAEKYFTAIGGGYQKVRLEDIPVRKAGDKWDSGLKFRGLLRIELPEETELTSFEALYDINDDYILFLDNKLDGLTPIYPHADAGAGLQPRCGEFLPKDTRYVYVIVPSGDLLYSIASPRVNTCHK